MRAYRPHWIVALTMSALTACGNSGHQPPAPPPPRPVLIYEVSAVSAPWEKEYPATLRAPRKTVLGFETGGRLATVRVKAGEHVSAGQTLAELDSETRRLRLEQAAAARDAAAAALSDRRRQLAIQEDLRREALAAEPSVTAARNALDASEAQHKEAESQVALAAADLRRARLIAPFDGWVTRRMADPYIDLQPGQGVLELEGDGKLDVESLLPATAAARLHLGQAVNVLLPDRSAPVEAVIRQIGARIEMGALMPVVARLKNLPSGLRSGQSARLSIEANSETTRYVGVPINAVMPAAQTGEGNVFVLDPTGGRVATRPVRLHPVLLNGEQVAVAGLQPGDRIVAAGAAFLRDGQAVTVWRADGANDTGAGR